MSTLHIITSSFPHKPEFLNEEIKWLSREFSLIRVSPMRPSGRKVVHLPGNVVVDYTLAETLEPRNRAFGAKSRYIAAVQNFIEPSRVSDLRLLSKGIRSKERAPFFRIWLQRKCDNVAVTKWAKKISKPDLIYCFWLGISALGVSSVWPDIPIICRAHGSDVFGGSAFGLKTYPFQREIVESSSVVATVSDKGGQFLRSLYPDQANKITTRRLGVVDIGRSETSPRKSGIIKVVSASNVIPCKRVPLIAEVLKEFSKKYYCVEWHHFGDGPSLKALQGCINTRPKNLDVYLHGRVPLEVVHKALRTSGYDAFLNLSSSEGAPVSLMEAQSAGLPVLATDVGGTSEVVPDSLNELVHKDASVDELVSALHRLIHRDPTECEQRRTYWAARYSAEKNYPSWAAELKHLA